MPMCPDGQPGWPSEQYRRDYEQALAQQAVARDRRRSPVRIVLAVIVAVVVALITIGGIRDIATGGKQGQQDACAIYRQDNVAPPPGQTCP